MEKAMNPGAEALARAVSSGLTSGDEIAPDTLLVAVSSHDDPLQAVNDHDISNEIFGALNGALNFLDFVRATVQFPPSDEFDRFVGLLRWNIREIANLGRC